MIRFNPLALEDIRIQWRIEIGCHPDFTSKQPEGAFVRFLRTFLRAFHITDISLLAHLLRTERIRAKLLKLRTATGREGETSQIQPLESKMNAYGQ